MILSISAAVALTLPLPPQERPDVVWTRPLEGTTARGALDACLSPSGSLFTLNAGSFGRPVHLFSYDEDHQIFSATQLDMDDYEVESICSDGADGLFAVGTVEGSSSTGGAPLGGVDVLLLHLTRTGVVQWAKRFGGADGDVGRDICRHPSGDLLLAGGTTSTDGFAGPPRGSSDGFVMRVTDTGDVVWAGRGGGPSRSSIFTKVTTNAQGDALCAGRSFFSGASYASGIAGWFDALGLPVTQQFGDDRYVDIAALDGGGGAILVGDNFQWGAGAVQRLAGSGTTSWLEYVVPPGSMTVSNPRIVETSPGEFTVIAQVVSGPFSNQLVAVGFSADGTRGEPSYFRAAATGTDYVRTLLSDGQASAFMVSSRSGGSSGLISSLSRLAQGSLGSPGCPGKPNSTGGTARLRGIGSDQHSINRLTVTVSDLPPSRPGLLLVSPDQGFVANPAGSDGDLCLGGPIGRFARAGEIWDSGESGSAYLDLDLGDLPAPTGSTTAAPGETWWFQAWYRDLGTSRNFSNSVGVAFQ